MKYVYLSFLLIVTGLVQAQPYIWLSGKQTNLAYPEGNGDTVKRAVAIKVSYNGTMPDKTGKKIYFITRNSSNTALIPNGVLLDSLTLQLSDFGTVVKEKTLEVQLPLKTAETPENSEMVYIAIKDDPEGSPMQRVNIEKAAAKEETSAIAKQLAERQLQLAKQDDSLEVVARIVMRKEVTIRMGSSKTKEIKKDSLTKSDSSSANHPVSVSDTILSFSKKNKQPKGVKINRVAISVREGIMTEILVQTDGGTFRNKDAIIDILHIETRGSDRLGYVATTYRGADGFGSYIYLDDVIEYVPLRSFKNLPYSDFDIILTPEADVYEIKESTSINTYFDIAAFTDIKGISGDPNGIAQFTADAKFITNTRNIKGTSVIPGHFVSFSGGLSKFDNDFKGTFVHHHDSVNRRDLLQRTLYRVGVKVNLFRNFSPPTPRFIFDDFQVNAGFNFAGSKILDTVVKAGVVLDTVYRTVTQNQFFLEPRLVLSRHKNFSMFLTLPFYFNSVKKSAGLKNDGMEYWAAPSIALMYFGKRDSKSRIFFRYYHWINLKDKTQAFTQMQLGYSVNLTDVWSSK